MLNLMNGLDYGNCVCIKKNSSLKPLCFKGITHPLRQEDIDDMTKLKNKKCLLETIDKLKKSDKNFSIAMVDMDNFKSINELFGYKTGDDFIIKIGETVAESKLDAYRFGGDEFIILFSQNESMEEQKKAVNNLLKNINQTLNSHPVENIYEKTAYKKIDILNKSDKKIKKLQKNKYAQEILMDFRKNCETKEAKNDEYLFKRLSSLGESISFSYNNLLNECIVNECNENKRNMLKEMKLKHGSFVGLKKKEIKELDEYFTDIYDKTTNISRLKSCIKDFKNHNGFCATCAIVTFDKNYVKDKDAKDLIAETGKILQAGKDKQKGKYYFEGPSFGKQLNLKIIPIAQYKKYEENIDGSTLKAMV